MTACVDGNFGLVRKRNAGASLSGPLYNNVYFVDGSEVDSFVQLHSHDRDGDKVCSVQFPCTDTLLATAVVVGLEMYRLYNCNHLPGRWLQL